MVSRIYAGHCLCTVSRRPLDSGISCPLLRVAHRCILTRNDSYIVAGMFLRTLSVGKLTEKVLKLFLATDYEEIILLVQLLNIKQPLIPVLPTIHHSLHHELCFFFGCSPKFCECCVSCSC
ncbi:hypothetical protein ZWY2020_037308 [Hordeum vulgare]|nr:hypothetical protein ZWY2020_037308 [Hordeum vulgare]